MVAILLFQGVSYNAFAEIYHNEKYQFSIEYPDNWVYEEDFEMGDETFGMVSFLDEIPNWSAEISITNWDLDSSTSYLSDQQYLNALIKDEEYLCVTATFEIDGYQCSDFNLTNSEILTVNEKKAFRVQYTYTEHYSDDVSDDITILITEVRDNNKAWSILSSAYTDDFPQYLKTFDSSHRSFQLEYSANENIIPSSEYLSYSNSILGYQIKHPSDWNFVDSESPGINMIMFTSPVQNVNNVPEAFAMLLTIRLDTSIDLFDLSEMVTHEMKTNFGLQNFKISENYETALDQIPAQKMKFSGMFESDIPIVGTATWTIKDGLAYIFYFISEPKSYTENSSIGKSMEGSIKFTELPKVIKGEYSDPDLGISMEFPQDWITLESTEDLEFVGKSKGVTSIAPKYSETMNINDFVLLGLISMKIPETVNYESITGKIEEMGCEMSKEAKIIEIKKMKAMEMDMICVYPNTEGPIKILMHMFYTKENLIGTMYGAGSDLAFENNFSKFEKFQNSLYIDKTLNLSDSYEMAKISDVTVNKHQIQVESNNVEILTISDAQITNVSFNDNDQELSLSVRSPSGISSSVEIKSIDNLIEPPYEIKISEIPADNYIVLEDLTTNERSISMSFEGSTEIKIIGNLNETPNEITNTAQIPDWIRNNASWWVQGNIDNKAFVGGIQFLIKEGLIQIPETTQSDTAESSLEIPTWIKNNADWWSQGLISDNDFIKGITFMVENGIITV
ncbi:MAG: hypothetical protein OEL81_00220 [Nitrosopumilus sp.]|nr:hypothetical protein [Nitrosopumilus sp.]